jgi:hypothetical protein
MADQTPTLKMPYIMPSQAQKHVTHNQSLEILDAVVQLSVLSKAAAAPPGDPDEGDPLHRRRGPLRRLERT